MIYIYDGLQKYLPLRNILFTFSFQMCFPCLTNRVQQDPFSYFRSGAEVHPGICSLCVGPINKLELPLTFSLLRWPERDRYDMRPHASTLRKHTALDILNTQLVLHSCRKSSLIRKRFFR